MVSSIQPADVPPELAAVLDRLMRLHPKLIDLSLDRVRALLATLGHPERRLPPVIHVAGTNGKGSTVAFLRAMLEAAGHRVHAYTSPHLVRFNERIRLAGELVSDDMLLDLLRRVEAANDDAPITYFEVTTCAAFLGFAEVPADLVLLETGLGGRLDATNMVARPAVTAITRISLDHTQFLGDTVTAIAAEKAGILKPGRPCVVQAQPDAGVLGVLEARAAALGCPLSLGGRDWRVAPAPGGFRYEGTGRALDLPAPALPGAHQLANAGTAIACLEHLPLTVPDAAVAEGMRRVSWPARLQRLTRGPLVDLLPPGWELWLDGGHNDSGGAVLAEQARDWAADGKPMLLVYGMLGTKRPADFLAPLAPHVAGLAGIAIPDEDKTLSAEEAAAAAAALGIPSVAAEDAAAALRRLVGEAGGPARVLICGSLYLAGTILRENG
ncbi:MAG TPA: folylpolyglutamate synthase/dihydrofolate synthase family protein [Azospirillaceae bacterium]|nr:folylpolyglutamate synthase/dihydrofolate synthase family protein [Azospirillaceae bacterium]